MIIANCNRERLHPESVFNRYASKGIMTLLNIVSYFNQTINYNKVCT